MIIIITIITIFIVIVIIIFLLVDDDGCDFTRHLNGTILESFVRPAVLITDAYNALNNQPSRRQRDQEFLGIALSCIIDFLKRCQF